MSLERRVKLGHMPISALQSKTNTFTPPGNKLNAAFPPQPLIAGVAYICEQHPWGPVATN